MMERRHSGAAVLQDLRVGDLRIIQSVSCTTRKQFRFPHSKRRRSRAKWQKREINYRHLPDPNMYVMRDQGAVVMHPATWRKLERGLSGANKERHAPSGAR